MRTYVIKDIMIHNFELWMNAYLHIWTQRYDLLKKLNQNKYVTKESEISCMKFRNETASERI